MPSSMSPLRYPGGKAKIYPYVRELLVNNNLLGETYIEPFAGGAGLALKLLINKDVKRIVINDLDPAIYSFWYSVLNYTDDLCMLIDSASLDQNEWLRQREIYSKMDIGNVLELGFSTFYLNRTNVSGVIKGGMIGGQSQQGEYRLDARFNKESLINRIRRISEHRESIILLNMDTKELLASNHLRKYYKAFINFDPPYVRKGAQLYKNSFSEADHRELSVLIAQCKRKWIVTYDICPLVAELYQKFQYSYLDVVYSVKGSKRAQEYIFYSKNMSVPENTILLNKD